MKSSALAFDREVRRARVFGTSALEIMLVITFILVLLLLAFSWTAADTEPGLRVAEAAAGGTVAGSPAPLETEPGLASGRPGNPDAAPVSESRRANAAETAERANAAERANTAERSDTAARGTAPREGRSGHRWPPIIRLREADGYVFPSAKNRISPDFARRLRAEVVPLIEKYAEEYDADVVEVIGHTDERPIGGRSNLDEALGEYLTGDYRPLRPADNVGLAFARAAAVARRLAPLLEERGYLVLALSAGQTLLPGDGGLADGSDPGDNPARRTIEIRLRRRARP